ncbi:hypothetical protein C8F04DRAFT_1130510 [Mycena alexandri]|uniref:Uncharacterized protein n=1 Tax=Mycena alexandri TaxID=1745969 RepID=A0AAD6SBG2_9AGAR|nr:hypothetical protein C8F04DRAFT_1130510 [Mycena alexandri]
MWLNPAAAYITASQRRAHAESRRCCGLTKKYALCNNNPGGNYRYCWRHGGQAAHANVGAAPGAEAPQRAVVRERMREFERMQRESEGRSQDTHDQWAREEQRRREEAHARAEREEEERQRAREEQQQQEQRARQEEERAQQEEERAQRERFHRENDWQWSYQRQRPPPRNPGQGARQAEEERERQQEQARREQEQARRAEAERQRRQATEDQDPQFRARCLQRYLDKCEIFDKTVFSSRSPNNFSLIPWPVILRVEGTVSPGDITPENVRLFFDSTALRRFKTEREIKVILKNTARRFHPDRFSPNRPVVGSIHDLEARRAVTEAVDVVIKTVNVCRGV